MDKKMTIFYRKLKNNKIDRVIQGEQTLKSYVQIEEDEASLLYGLLIIDFNPLILNNFNYYQVVEENGEMKVKLKEEYKDIFTKYM